MKYWHRRIHLFVWLIMLIALAAAFITFAGIISNNNLQSSINVTADNSTGGLPNFIEWEEELDRAKQEGDEEKDATKDNKENEEK